VVCQQPTIDMAQWIRRSSVQPAVVEGVMFISYKLAMLGFELPRAGTISCILFDRYCWLGLDSENCARQIFFLAPA